MSKIKFNMLRGFEPVPTEEYYMDFLIDQKGVDHVKAYSFKNMYLSCINDAIYPVIDENGKLNYEKLDWYDLLEFFITSEIPHYFAEDEFGNGMLFF